MLYDWKVIGEKSVKGVRRTFILPFTDKKKIHNSDRGYETIFAHILLFNLSLLIYQGVTA